MSVPWLLSRVPQTGALASRGITTLSARRFEFITGMARQPEDLFHRLAPSGCRDDTVDNQPEAGNLLRRGQASGIRAFAVHPGAVLTDLSRHMTDDELRAFGLARTDGIGFIPAGKSVAEGGEFKTLQQAAATSVWCAASPQLTGMGGVYCQDVEIAPILPPESSSNVGVRPYAIDPKAAQRLWTLSEELTGVRI
jgi:hypothetical protein